MESLDHGHGGPYSQVPVDPNELFRDVAGSSSGRTESRAKARERARERAKEKQHTETGYAATPSPSPLPAPPQYANLQVSSALQHPFQAPRQAPPPYHQSSYFPEAAFSSPPFGGYPTGSYEPSFSQYFVDNPPTAAARFPTQVPNPSFSPGPSRFSGLLSDPGFGYLSSPYPNPPPQRPRLPVFPQPPSSHVVVRPPPPATPQQQQQQQQQQQHTLDPNFYYPQMPSFEELEEEFKP